MKRPNAERDIRASKNALFSRLLRQPFLLLLTWDTVGPLLPFLGDAESLHPCSRPNGGYPLR